MTALLAVLALLLAACGDDTDDTEETDEQSEETEDTEDSSDETDEGDDAEESEEPEESDDGTAAADRFAGETLTLIVPYSPGGGYDTYLRSIAPYVEEHSGATTVVENQPGAGGLQAANSLSVEEDPTQLMIANGPGFASAGIAGAEGVRFEFADFTFLGRLISEPHVLVVAGDSDIESFEQLREQGSFSWGVTGPGSTAIINSTVIGDVFGLDVEIVPGFEGSGEIQTALLRGDIDVMSIEPSSALAAIEGGDVRPLMVFSDARSDLIPDTPALTDLELTEEEQSLLEVHFALFEIGRAIIAPPGIDEADASALREIIEAAATDSDFQAEMEGANRPLSFANGDEVSEMVQTVADAPDRYVGLIQQAFE